MKSYLGIGDVPTYSTGKSIALDLIHLYTTGEYDEIHLVFSKFRSAMSNTPTDMQLLPSFLWKRWKRKKNLRMRRMVSFPTTSSNLRKKLSSVCCFPLMWKPWSSVHCWNPRPVNMEQNDGHERCHRQCGRTHPKLDFDLEQSTSSCYYHRNYRNRRRCCRPRINFKS